MSSPSEPSRPTGRHGGPPVALPGRQVRALPAAPPDGNVGGPDDETITRRPTPGVQDPGGWFSNPGPPGAGQPGYPGQQPGPPGYGPAGPGDATRRMPGGPYQGQ